MKVKINVREKKFVRYKMLQNKIKVKKFDIFSLIIIILTFGLDRLSKVYVINLIEKSQSELFINDYLNITLNWNRGIAFGLLSFNATTVYHLISILILTIIIYLIYLMVKSDSLGKILFALIIGGAVGNLFDRFTYFAVADFIDFHIESYHWFTFNLADIFISIGIFLMIIKELFYKQNL